MGATTSHPPVSWQDTIFILISAIIGNWESNSGYAPKIGGHLNLTSYRLLLAQFKTE
jgi:hypothetical protein